MHVYRRPHDYAQQAAIPRWQPQSHWFFDLSTSSLVLTTYPWTMGLSPTIEMTVANLTLTTPAWTVTLPKTVEYGPALLTMSVPAWTIVNTVVATVPDVVGDTLSTAYTKTLGVTLIPKIAFTHTGSVSAGLVTAQSPAAGTLLQQGTLIEITVEYGEYAWPSGIVVQQSEWRLIHDAVAYVSPLTGKTRTHGKGGERWACTLTARHLKGDDRRRVQAFLARLRGPLNVALLPDDAYRKRGTLTANLLVKGADQSGTALLCDGATPATGTVRAGDMVSVESRLYMIATDATAVAGDITLTLTPPLNEPPADNAAVTVLAPVGHFVLGGNTGAGWSNAPGGFTSFEAIEFFEDRH